MDRQTRIVIFAKAPIPGFCKTRLIDVLGAEGAATLARKMLCRTVLIAQEANIGPVELCVSPDPDHPFLRSINFASELVWSRQAEGDLGARMAEAAERTLGGGENVLCIGTDCLELEVRHLKDAARALDHAPVVIAPALDGGYVLLGLSQFESSIFHNMMWSTDSVLRETLRRIDCLGWRVTQLETLRDIDQPRDLVFLPDAFK